MCGISGFFGNNELNYRSVLSSMASSISHRGPNNEGLWYKKELGIGLIHRRLSIIDVSSNGNQPMISESGRFVISFNGEIYNYKEIRNKLSVFIPKWKGNSDTEVFLGAIEKWGLDKALEEAVGMFAFALWDNKHSKLILCRDRIGEKPLYYGVFKNNVIFGSEIRAIKKHPLFKEDIDRDVLSCYVKIGFIPSPYSIYKNVFKITPGSYITFEAEDLKRNTNFNNKKVMYWNVKKYINQESKLNDLSINFEEILHDQIKKTISGQLNSDVSIGAFLSGGVDSTLITSIMQRLSSKKIETFTLGFEDPEFDESIHARKIAKYLNTDHNELILNEINLLSIISDIGNIYDEPFSDASQIATIALAKFASKKIKVALSGDGGDELLGGYNRYVWANIFNNYFFGFPESLKKSIKFLLLNFSGPRLDFFVKLLLPKDHKHDQLSEKIIKFSKLFDSRNPAEIYLNCISRWPITEKKPLVLNGKFEFIEHFPFLEFDGDLVNYMVNADKLMYLPDSILVKTDRASMAFGMEVRAPYLDHRIFDLVSKYPTQLIFHNRPSKLIFKKILEKYIPVNLVDRPKKGFSIPINYWTRGVLRDWAESLLDKKKLSQQGFFDYQQIHLKWCEHLSGAIDFGHEIWTILMFQSWLEANK
jgi:asparagine synthase (glutamine-hydrolysing)